MTTTGDESDRAFVDTNILIYAAVPAAPHHRAALSTLSDLEAAGTSLWISHQVIREYLAVLSRPQGFTPPLDAQILAGDAERLEDRFQVAEDGPSVTARLLLLLRTFRVGGKQVHDANIVATMQVHGIPKLLTHNAQDFRRFAPMIEVATLDPHPLTRNPSPRPHGLCEDEGGSGKPKK